MRGGCVQGNYRCSLVGLDLNRCWAAPSKKKHPTIYAARAMLGRLVSSQGVEAFVDVHGHNQETESFMYGCQPQHCLAPGECVPAECKCRGRVRLLPYLLSRMSSLFSLRKCSFRVQRQKLSAARVVCARHIGIPYSYTLEASVAGGAGRHYNINDFEGLGHSLGLALASFSTGQWASKVDELSEPSAFTNDYNDEPLDSDDEEGVHSLTTTTTTTSDEANPSLLPSEHGPTLSSPTLSPLPTEPLRRRRASTPSF